MDSALRLTPSDSKVDLVNPLQGTASTFNFSNGNTLPLIAAPWGMTTWSAQTSEQPGWFFHPDDPHLQGLRVTHQPSPWIQDYGHFTIMPQTGERLLTAQARASSYVMRKAVYRPHYFRAFLERYRIDMEFTPTCRCGLMQLKFADAQDARVIIQPLKGESHFRFDFDTNCITGYTRGNSSSVPDNFACYFVIRPDVPLDRTEYGTFRGAETHERIMDNTGDALGAFAGLRVDSGRPVLLAVGASFVSVEQARANLDAEIGEKGFSAVRDEARDEWNSRLSTVTIDASTEEQARTFYSALYRCMIFPRVWYEYDRSGGPIHYSPYTGRVEKGILYADNGFWDTHRTVYPLLSIIAPTRLSEMLEGFITSYRESGWFSKWNSPGHRTCMIGTHIDAIIADAAVKGIDFDVETAYEGILKNATVPPDGAWNVGRRGLEQYVARGYVPEDIADESASRTMDFAYGDFCVAQVARLLGRTEEYDTLMQRAGNYRHVFDRGVGFMRGRVSDGSWVEPFDEFRWGTPFVEGSVWQCGFAVPHDPRGLAELMGGREALVSKLEHLFALPPRFDVGCYQRELHEMSEMAAVNFGQYAHCNQPAHHIPYLFAACGTPHLTQYWTRRVLQLLYSSGPTGLPGDEDNGEMSAWYVLSALGFYPLCPGVPEYVYTSPLFTKARLHLENAREFTISAPANSPEHVYAANPILNATPTDHLTIDHSAIVSGGTLEWHMSTRPTLRTYGTQQLPFSMRDAYRGECLVEGGEYTGDRI